MYTQKRTGTKRVLSLLLTVIMLLGLVPMAALPVSAAQESHPKSVGNLDGTKVGYYTSANRFETLPASDFNGANGETKWLNFTRLYAGKKGVVGLIYYDLATGTVYVRGEVRTLWSVVSTDDQDVLRIVADGDTTIKNQIYCSIGLNNKSFKKLSFVLRNNATLTLNGYTDDNGKRPQKDALLDITWVEELGDHSDLHSYGDLEVRGTGTLKFTTNDYSKYYYGIRANSVSVLDNTSLDIKMGTRRSKFASGASMAAIACYQFNINTTGKVTVDVSKKIDPNGKDGNGFFDALCLLDGINGFNLVKAKKVTFTSAKKSDSIVTYGGTYIPAWIETLRTALGAKNWVISDATAKDESAYEIVFTNNNNRPAPDVVKSYTSNAGNDETALRQGQAKFTWVEIYSDRDGWVSSDTYNEMTAKVRCEIVDANIAKRIGYNSGNPAVTDEGLLYDLKVKLKSSKMYHAPSERELNLKKYGNMISPATVGKGTFRYLLSVEAYFNDTYYFDGAGISFEEGYSGKRTKFGTTSNYVAATVTGIVIFPDTDSGLGDPPTKLKLVIDNYIGREFTATNTAPRAAYYLDDYPDKYVANFRRILMPNTDLDIELKTGSVLHVGKYLSNGKPSTAGSLSNIQADNLTVRGNGVLLASTLDNAHGENRTAGSAVKANTFTVIGSGVDLDLRRDENYNCIVLSSPSAFKPINAKSIKLAAVNGSWIRGIANTEAQLRKYYGTRWDIFDIAKKRQLNRDFNTVTFGRTEATLDDPILTLGGVNYEKGAYVPEYVIKNGNDTFSITFAASPQWYKMLCNENQIKSNASIEIWKDGVNQGKLTVNEQYNYSYENTVKYRLSVPNFKLEGGHVYTIYCDMNPYSGSTRITGGNYAKWSFYVSDGTATGVISQASLYQDDDLRPDMTVSYNDIKKPMSGEFYISSQTDWNGTYSSDGRLISGNTYTKTVVLKPNSGYRFSQYCPVTIDNQNTEIVGYTRAPDGKTLTVYLESTAVEVIDTAIGTLEGFYLGKRTDLAYVVSAEPDKYDIDLYYVAEKHSGGLSDTYLFQSGSAYVFGLEVHPKKGYAFNNGRYGTVKLNATAHERDGGKQTLLTSYKKGVYVENNYYTGNFYETAECVAAPGQTLERLDIFVKQPVADTVATGSEYKTAGVAQADYNVTEFYWQNLKDSGKFTGTFQNGTTHYYFITVECPWYIEPNDDNIYVNGVNCYAYSYEENGKTYIDAYDQMAVTAMSENATVSGTVTSFGSETDEILIQLLEDELSEPAYEVVVHGNNTTFSIPNVTPGKYKVKAMKKGHATAEYFITVKADLTLAISLSLNGGINVYGAATSFGSQTDDVTIQLIESGMSEAAYEVAVQGNSIGYAIENVAPGSYTLKVIKKNHVTREYQVTVGSENVKQDVKIHLLGDITGDGKVNMKDWASVYAHVNETKLLTGYELKCAEVTGDGKVTMKDWNRIYAHVNETNPLW